MTDMRDPRHVAEIDAITALPEDQRWQVLRTLWQIDPDNARVFMAPRHLREIGLPQPAPSWVVINYHTLAPVIGRWTMPAARVQGVSVE